MADPSPADADAEGQAPDADEGQAPDGNDDGSDAEKDAGKEPRSYPEVYVRQLRREAASHRNRTAELEEKLQEFTDRDKTEQERLAERAAAAEKRASDAETRVLRYEVAAERGLDAAAASFLTGSTREELELRAEELEKLLGDRPKPAAAGFDGGARRPAPEKGPPEKEHNDFLLRALGRQPSP
jgi:hypothetical protein